MKVILKGLSKLISSLITPEMKKQVFVYLGDKLVSKRMNKWPWWYPLQTAKSIVQSVGRSIRTSEDYAVTYILDAGWNYFYHKNKSVFPPDFKKCLKSFS